MHRPIYFRDILKSWKNKDIQLFKQHIHKLPAKQVRLVIRILERKSSKLLNEENFEYAKIILEWVKSNHKKYALNWSILEKSLILNKSSPHIKEKNILYLQLCELFLESKYIERLPISFAQYWPEGWTQFSLKNMSKMSVKVKKDYLIKTFLYINPEFNEQVKQLLTQSEIENILQKQSQFMGQNLFWANDNPKSEKFKDDKTLYLLQWSEALGACIQGNMNIYDYCSKEWEKTFSYLVEKIGSIYFNNQIIPVLEQKNLQDIELFKTWLSFYGLAHTLDSKDMTNDKVQKI